MKHGFILPDIVIAKVESCGTTEVASLFASTITRSDELVEEEPKKKNQNRGGKLKHCERKERVSLIHCLGFISACWKLVSKVRKTRSLWVITHLSGVSWTICQLWILAGVVCWYDPQPPYYCITGENCAALPQRKILQKPAWDCGERWAKRKKKSLVTDLGIGVGSSPWFPPSVPGIRLPRRRVRCTPLSAAGCRWSRRQSRSSSSTTHSSCRPLSGPKRDNKTECENRSHWKEACVRVSGLCLQGTKAGEDKPES